MPEMWFNAGGSYWLQVIILLVMAILSVVVMVSLYFWRQSERLNTTTRETLIYRLSQLEARLRQQEEFSRTAIEAIYSLQETRAELKASLEAEPLPVNPALAPSPPPQLSPQVAEILQRSQRGQSVLDIAQEMGLGQGEVQLIIALEGNIRSGRNR
ncbi:MAG: hypothetical protein FWF06_04780 [Symbiobacteriaceae bacterium]|nr:hypothetical protein [Symbiobacteriaceae bacterium]